MSNSSVRASPSPRAPSSRSWTATSSGQRAAKRAVAVALRNRWRRQQVPPPLRDEISPKNIMMIGPTGVGKTEIARRLAKLAGAPFVKVEASKFTEVGYVGRDVDSMVRDLAETAVSMLRDEERERVRGRARENAEERLLDVLLPPMPRAQRPGPPADARRSAFPLPAPGASPAEQRARRHRHPREPAPAAARGEARRPHRRDRHRRRAHLVHRRLLRHRHGGDGAQPEGHVPGWPPHQAAASQAPRGARGPHRGGGEQAARHGSHHQGGGPPGRAGRDHLHR